MGYSNWISYYLFDGATGRTIIKIDIFSELPVISVSDTIKKDYIGALEVYYIETVIKF